MTTKKDSKWEVLGIFIFFLLATTGIMHHELWLDEAHHWLLARDSKSLKELWINTRYEGHPILWNSLLYIITRLTHNPQYMQFFHLSIALSSAYIILFKLNYSAIQKILILPGYFVIYEYTVISRNYALILFFFLIIIRELQLKPCNFLFLACSISLLANCHLFGLMIASCITVVLVLNYKNFQLTGYASIFFFLIVTMGTLIAILQIIPPPDSVFMANKKFNFSAINFSHALSLPIRAMIPIPDFFDYYFWNSNLIIRFSKIFAGLISSFLIMFPLSSFKKKESIILFYLFTAQLILFTSFTGFASQRYAGMIFVVFIGCLALERSQYGSTINVNFPKLSDFSTSIITLVILSVQSFSGLYALTMDIAYPFSESKSTVYFLEKNNLKDRVILGEFCKCATISAYAKKKVYYIELNEFGSYCSWNWIDHHFKDDEALLKHAVNIAARLKQPPIFIHDKNFLLDNEFGENFRLIASFKRSIIRSENFYVFEVVPSKILAE